MAYKFLSTISGISTTFTGNSVYSNSTPNRTVKLDAIGLYLSRTSDGAYPSSITADGTMYYDTRNSHIFRNDGTASMTIVDNTRNVLIGTSTDAGYKLYVNGSGTFSGELRLTGNLATGGNRNYILGSSADFEVTTNTVVKFRNYYNSSDIYFLLDYSNGGRATFSGASATGYRLTTSGSVTPSSAVARGAYFNNTLVAAANNDVLVGLDITPTFTNGAFTGVSNFALRANGIAQVNSGLGAVSTFALSVTGSSSTLFSIRGFGDANLAATLYLGGYGGSNYISNGTLNILSSQATGNQFIRFTHNNGTNALRVLSNSVIELNPSAGNVLVGTTTDAGYKLDVLGTIRAYNTSNGQSTIRIDTNGTSDMAAQLVFMQNSPNWSSQIGTHTSGGGVNYGLQFRSQASVVNMVMNRDGSNYFGGTFALASARVHIKGSGSTSSTSSLLIQNSSSTELFRVRDDGNIGIGTSSPSYKLDVNGTVRATSVITDTVTTTDSTTLAGYSGGTYTYGPLTANQSTYTFTFGFFNVLYGNITSGYVPKANTIGMGNSAIYNPGSNNVLIGSTTDNGNKLQVTGNITASGGVIASTLGAQNSAEVNVNESSNNLLVYADITGGSNKLYSGGQVKANIYTSSVTTPTVINTGTTVSLMEWYPTTTQGVMIDYVFYIASGNYMRSGTFTAVNDNAGNTQYVDNATPDLNGSTSTVTFAAVDIGGTIEFQVTNASGSPVYMNILTRYIPNIF